MVSRSNVPLHQGKHETETRLIALYFNIGMFHTRMFGIYKLG